MQWYNIKEHIPKTRDNGAGWGYYESKPIIVTDGKTVDIGIYHEKYNNKGELETYWWECDPWIDTVTHWMSLPNLPEGE
jgi:hypothetical protein